MFRLGPGGLAIAALLLLVGFGFGLTRFAGHHYDRGYAARSVEMQAALDAAQADLDAVQAKASEAAHALSQAEALNLSLFEELADEADRDPDGIHLPADSVRRLNAVAGYAAD